MLKTAERILVLLLVASASGCAAKKIFLDWPLKGNIVYVSERLVPLSKSSEIRSPEQGEDSRVQQIPLDRMRTLASYPPCQPLEVTKVTIESLHLWHMEDGQVFKMTGKWESLVHDTREKCLQRIEPGLIQGGEEELPERS